MSDDFRKVPEAFRISRATLRSIRRDMAVALATVAALLAGVLAGSLRMAGAMLIHEASVFIVILNALRLNRRNPLARGGRAPYHERHGSQDHH